MVASDDNEPAPALASAVESLDRKLGAIELALLTASLAVLVGVGTLQAVLGNLFDSTLGWTNEVVRFSVFFIAMSGAAYAAHRQRLISMDVLARLFNARQRAMVRVVTAVFTIAACAILFVGGLDVRSIAAGEHYQVIPPGIGLLALPVGALLIAIHVGLRAVVEVSYLARGRTAPHEESAVH